MKAILITAFLLVCSGYLFAQEDTYKTTSARVDGILYKAIYKSSDLSISIVKPKGKVVSYLGNDDGYSISSFKFVDFNDDGYKDLLIEYTSNTPGVCNLLLYDKHIKRFALLKDFPQYPAPEILKGTHLYYSYHHSGCADEDWDSDLFKIVNNQIIKIGNISGNGCDVKPRIFISKIQGEKKTPVKKYPIGEIEKYKNYKWGFIKHYWESNYKKFF